MLRFINCYAEFHYAECCYAECRYAECRGAHPFYFLNGWWYVKSFGHFLFSSTYLKWLGIPGHSWAFLGITLVQRSGAWIASCYVIIASFKVVLHGSLAFCVFCIIYHSAALCVILHFALPFLSILCFKLSFCYALHHFE